MLYVMMDHQVYIFFLFINFVCRGDADKHEIKRTLAPVGNAGGSEVDSEDSPENRFGETFISNGDASWWGHQFMITLQQFINDNETERQFTSNYYGDGQKQCYGTMVQKAPSWFHFCGGALIEKDMVLTAAHCLDEHLEDPDYLENLRVGMGWRNLKYGTDHKDHQTSKIKEVFIHPDFMESGKDLAVIQLVSPANFTNTVGTIALDDGSVSSSSCRVYGWGKTHYDTGAKGAECSYPEGLRQASVKIIAQKECNEIWKLYGQLRYDDKKKFQVNR